MLVIQKSFPQDTKKLLFAMWIQHLEWETFVYISQVFCCTMKHMFHAELSHDRKRKPSLQECKDFFLCQVYRAASHHREYGEH